MTRIQKNASLIGPDLPLLMNRLLWLALALSSLSLCVLLLSLRAS